LDNILSSQKPPTIKSGLSFHETVEGESSSQVEEKKLRSNNEKHEISQLDQQPRKVSLQRKSFTPNYRIFNRFSPLINIVECSICHNYGHVATNYRRRTYKSRGIIIFLFHIPSIVINGFVTKYIASKTISLKVPRI